MVQAVVGFLRQRPGIDPTVVSIRFNNNIY